MKAETLPIPCFECDGILEAVSRPYTTLLRDGSEVVIPDVPMLRCSSCGEMVIGEEGNRRIEDHLSRLHPGMFGRSKRTRR